MIVNGVTLPDIPAEVLEQYPYIFITHGESTLGTEAYTIIASATEFLHMSPDIFPDIEEGLYCLSDSKMIDYDSDEAAWNEDGSVLPAMTNLLVFQNAGIGTMTIVYSNYDIYTVASINADTEEFTKGEIYFPNSEAEEEPEETKPPRYSIATAILDAVARQIMRLTGSTSKVKPEEFEPLLEGVESAAGMINAEDSSFGSEDLDLQYGITSVLASTQAAANSGATVGCAFTPKETFMVYGVRTLYSSNCTEPIKLWGPDKNVIATIATPSTTPNGAEYYLETPIQVEIGKTYVFSRYKTGSWSYSSAMSSVSINPKMEIKAVLSFGDIYPEKSESYFFGYDPIIGRASSDDRPDEYAVKKITMDSLADEAKRITGTENRMTIEQIITALQGVPVQTASTEE